MIYEAKFYRYVTTTNNKYRGVRLSAKDIREARKNDTKREIVHACDICGVEITRNRITHHPVCFDCKQKRRYKAMKKAIIVRRERNSR